MNEDFKVTIGITRAYKKDDNLYIEGVASSTDVDSHETIFNKNCQEGFAIDINDSFDTDEPVVVEAEHKGDEEPMNIIGAIERAHVTEENELFIVARLDKDNPKAVYYHKILTNPDPKLGRPKRLGLSINGAVEDAYFEYNKELNRTIRVFNRVKLKKVGIVRAPSNPSTWVQKVVRSVDWSLVTTKENSMADKDLMVNEEVAISAVEDTSVERTEEVIVDEAVVEIERTEDAEVAADVAEEAVAAVDEVAVEVAETEAEVVAEEIVPEPTAGVLVVEREEEVAVDTTEETVERVEAWDAGKLLTALTHLTASMQEIESFVRNETWEVSEGNTPEGKMAKSALTIINGAVPLLLEALKVEMAPDANLPGEEERAMDTTNMAGHIHEDVSDEVEEVRSEEVEVERTEEVPAEDKIAAAIAMAVGSVKEELEHKIDELSSKLGEKETENKDLIERVKVLEGKPVSTPGGQHINYEEVARNAKKSQKDQYLDLVERAKASGDATELIKLQILGKWNNWV